MVFGGAVEWTVGVVLEVRLAMNRRMLHGNNAVEEDELRRVKVSVSCHVKAASHFYRLTLKPHFRLT